LLTGQRTLVGVEAETERIQLCGWVCKWCPAGYCWSAWSKRESQYCA